MLKGSMWHFKSFSVCRVSDTIFWGDPFVLSSLVVNPHPRQAAGSPVTRKQPGIIWNAKLMRSATFAESFLTIWTDIASQSLFLSVILLHSLHCLLHNSKSTFKFSSYLCILWIPATPTCSLTPNQNVSSGEAAGLLCLPHFPASSHQVHEPGNYFVNNHGFQFIRDVKPRKFFIKMAYKLIFLGKVLILKVHSYLNVSFSLKK